MSATAAKGFVASGVHCGIGKDGLDLALVRSTAPATGAAMFTANRVQAAPVKISKEHLGLAEPQAVVANSGNANAATGLRASVVGEGGGGGCEARQHIGERQRRPDHAGREDEHLFRCEPEEARRLGGRGARVELAAQAGGRVGDTRVHDHGLRLGVLEVLL